MWTDVRGKLRQYHLYIILMFGCAIRFLYIWNIPGNGNVHRDEAYAGYEAWSLLHYGYDSHGYVNPVYLKAWGSGMNALNTYLIIPFIRIFGLNNLSIRMPQMILGCLSLWAFYSILKRTTDDKFALTGLSVLVVTPWHIMISRFGLESNLLPGMLLIALIFLLKSEDHPKWLLLSALCYGLSLYCYAAPWPLMPFLIGLSVGHLLRQGKLKADWYLTGAAVILVVLAFPLLLFVLVNLGMIPEIRTGVISIPLLTEFRGGDVSFGIKVVFERIYRLYYLLVLQEENGLPETGFPEFGFYYHFASVFILTGLAVVLRDVVIRKEERRADFFFGVQFLCGLLLGLMTESTSWRINIIHIPMVYFACVGIQAVVRHFHDTAIYAVTLLYAVGFISFYAYYMTRGDDLIGTEWNDGFQEALAYCDSAQDGGDVHVREIPYSLILYYEEYPTNRFIETVQFSEDNLRFLQPISFDGYRFDGWEKPVAGDWYICKRDTEPAKLFENTMKRGEFGVYDVYRVSNADGD